MNIEALIEPFGHIHDREKLDAEFIRGKRLCTGQITCNLDRTNHVLTTHRPGGSKLARPDILNPRVQLLDEFGAAVHAELSIKIAAVVDRRVLADP